jgi:uncharacterized protein (DUF1015 family)
MESGHATVPPYVAGPIELSPFRALSLAPRRVGDPASARAFARPYRGVPQRLDTWLARRQATRDPEPAVYLHEYSDSGLTVRGLVGCLELTHLADDASTRRIYPHEGVHSRQVEELARRMGEMRLNPAPILLVHRGPTEIRELSSRLREEPPDREYVDHADQEHRVWAVTDPDQLAVIAAALADSRLLLADGHHRYAAYVALHDSSPSPETSRGLAMIVDQGETPLFLGAIHRVLHGVKITDLSQAATRAGADVTTIGEPEALAALAPDTVVLTDGSQWATARLPVPEGTAVVQLFDGVVVPQLARPPGKVGFAHSVAQALEQARPGRITAALLPAVDFDVVLSVVRGGGLLPEKATSFQPKPNLGSFIRLLDE